MKNKKIFLLCLMLFTCKVAAQWTTIGPDGGTIQNIFTNGLITVATTSGGVYYTTDNGNNWKACGDGLPGSYISSLIFVGDRIIAATYGGVYSTPIISGEWTPCNNGLTELSISSLISNGKYIYAGTQNKGVFRTSDNGANWIRLNDGLPDGPIKSLAYYGKSLFAANLSEGVFRLTNDGDEWTKVLTLRAASVAVNETKIFVVSESGALYTSTNNGDSWALNNKSNYINYIYSFGNNLFAFSNIGKSYFSDNNGENWNLIGGLNGMPISAFAKYNDNVFAATSRDGVYFSADNGSTWKPANNGIKGNDFHVLSYNNSRLFFGGNSGLYLSSDQGQSWKSIIANNTFNLGIIALTVNGDDFYVSAGNGFYVSNDNGKSWNKKNFNNSSDDLVTSLVNCGNNIFAATQSKGIYKSTDKGNSWIPVNKGLQYLMIGSLYSDGKNLFTGTGGSKFYISTDNGENWNSVDRNLPDLGGAVLSVSAIGNKIFAGSYKGICYSTNFGESWNRLYNNLSNKAVYTIKMIDSVLFAGTSAGIFLSIDEGITWSRINEGGNNYTRIVQALEYDGKFIYAGTWGNNVHKYSFLDLFGLSLSYPNGGENLVAGSKKTIYWNSRNIRNIRIEFSSDNGNNWQTIVSNIPANYGNYKLQIPNVSSEKCLIRVSSVERSVISSVSNVFKVNVLPTSVVFKVHMKYRFANLKNYPKVGVIGNRSPLLQNVPIWLQDEDKDLVYETELTFEPDFLYEIIQYKFVIENSNDLEVEGGVGDGDSSFRKIALHEGKNILSTVFYNNITTDIETNDSPKELSLSANYPNPFNPSTTIRYLIPVKKEPGVNSVVHILLTIYDSLGREISTLVNESKPPGSYSVVFNASHLPCGVYYYRLSWEGVRIVKKMVLLK